MTNQPDELTRARQLAQSAMEDEAHKRARAEALTLLAKRREEAIRSMEGQEWRRRREERELAQRQKISALEQELAATQKSAAEKAKGQQAALTETEVQTRQQERALNQKVDAIQSAEQTISRLKETASFLSPLRTLKSDMARAVKEEGVSVAKIAVAEQAKRATQAPPAGGAKPKAKSRLSALAIILILVIAGGGGFLWWQKYAPATPATTPGQTEAPPSLIWADASVAIDLANRLETSDIFAAIKIVSQPTQALSAGQSKLTQLYFTINGAVLGWEQLANLTRLNPPEVLTHSLTNDFMLGVLQTASSTERFLVLKTDLYNNARAGLLAWESRLPNDLFPWLYEISPNIPTSIFSDKLIRNKDARILTAVNGKIALFYTFLDNETIVITTSESSFLEVYRRFLDNNR